MKTVIILFFLISGWNLRVYAQQVRFVVAQDGTGDYQKIQDAISALPAFPLQRIEVFIKNGIYKEKLVVPSWNTLVSFIGEDKDQTVLTFDDYSGKGNINTFTSYTLLVQGNDFSAENMTIENSAGAFQGVGRLVGQAVALHVEGDKGTYKNLKILGNQDTFYSGSEGNRQYFKDCYIEGTTDFIFGPGIVFFDNCTIHSKKNSYITAASTPKDQPYGFVFLNCTLTAAPEVTEVYLGRPWRPYARTVFIDTFLGAHIKPEGWHNWGKPEAESTAFYAEYNSTGPGAKAESRVNWSKQLSHSESLKYSATKTLAGHDHWNIKQDLKY